MSEPAEGKARSARRLAMAGRPMFGRSHTPPVQGGRGMSEPAEGKARSARRLPVQEAEA